MTLFDHAFFLLMALVLPVIVFRKARESAGNPSGLSPTRNYLRNVLPWSAPALVLLLKWTNLERPFTDLGLGPGQWPVALLVALAAGIAVAGWWLATRTAAGRAQLLEPMLRRRGLHTPVAPCSPRELPAFVLLDLAETASDEVIYRAFVLFYLSAFLPTAGVLGVMIIIYAGSEAFRGQAGALRAALLATVNGALLVATGAIWAGVALQLGWRAARLLALIGHWPGKTDGLPHRAGENDQPPIRRHTG